MTAAWVVRAGRNGEREAEALNEGLAIIGWPELGDLSRFGTRQEWGAIDGLLAMLHAVDPLP